MLAAIATMLCALAIDPEPGPAVLAVVLCISLSRSQLDRSRRGRIEAALVLPAVGLIAVGVGLLLRFTPWIGAAVFTAGMFVSIWLRRFGPMAGRAGSLIALPFVALLSTPYIPTTRVTPIPAFLMPVLVALLALLWVGVLHALGRRMCLLPPAKTMERPLPVPAPASSLRPVASTRMAIQMAMALALSFVIGYVFFPERWSWVVLTAFIVNSGNRGRLDVVYKSLLRVLGAAAGTLVALSIGMHLGSHREGTAALILVVLFLGLWLRPLSYAWWALFVTIALALLQGLAGSPNLNLLWPRLEEIVIGALIGIVCAWFVLPVRSSAVLRRRLADALATLSEALDPANPGRSSQHFVAALDDVEQLRPAFHASRFVTRRFRVSHPADWVDTLIACKHSATALIDRGETPGGIRRAVGAARQSIREPEEILPALQGLHRVLHGQPYDKQPIRSSSEAVHTG
ncbi:FUSC family protein [Dyella silvatica]|uniref:FUSC family protein n=1 Tax=Dyella silvatica TaxID=2992128 RepID=UPI0022586BC7|nr:FUSC family protein [Dyella silvatica]